ncbi:MAG: 3'-5' exonuclease [archaeon]|nr:3'-5' exonuclease [archaeon]
MVDFGTFSDFSLPDRILVLDTETTGLKGGRLESHPLMERLLRSSQDVPDEVFNDMDWSMCGDLVVEVGLCEVDLVAHTVREVYSSLVGYDITSWTDEMRSAWIFENSYISLDEVAGARPFTEVRRDLVEIIRGRHLTTYNVQFDLDRFLYRFPWNLKGLFTECRDIMFSATDYCKLESTRPGQEYRYPTLEHAYENVFGGSDPAGIGDDPGHRALVDAKAAAHVLLGLHDRGCYDILDYSGRHGRA